MVWHMFIVKKLSSAAFLMDKVMISYQSAVSFVADRLLTHRVLVFTTC